MPKICFVPKQFRAKTLAIIEQAQGILEEYSDYAITVRTLYYQFVARNLIENAISSYHLIVRTLTDARNAGLIDWNAIEDRARDLIVPPTWSCPRTAIEAVARQYRLDLWEDHEVRPEVWIEKVALIPVIEDICWKYGVGLFGCRGYVSCSEMFDAGDSRIRLRSENKQRSVIIHLGDHDPSGLDMTRDIEERVSRYAGELVEVRRIALNMDQVEQYELPPNFAKQTDTRFREYHARFGDESWELDALAPDVLVGLVENAINTYRDPDLWDEMEARQGEDRACLKELVDRWDEVQELLS